MPVYEYKCPDCGLLAKQIRKMSDIDKNIPECIHMNKDGMFSIPMKLIPSVPSPMQWGCKRF